MRTKIIILSCLFAVAGLIVLAQSCQMEPGDSYAHDIKKYRYELDHRMKTDPNSPIPREHRIRFIGLSYFEPDAGYNVNARFEKKETPKLFSVQYSGGEVAEFYNVGDLVFKLKGHECKLAALVPADDMANAKRKNLLSVFFFDATNGKETYGGGRYLEVEYVPGKEVVMDFNKAFNPYCAYSHASSCPVPPKENTLSFKVEAGEKMLDANKQMF